MAVILRDCFIGNFPITQLYGVNKDLYKAYWPGGHEGVDFATPNGVVAIASTPGVVLHAGQEAAWANYGNFVEVWDDVQHCATLYGHLKDVAVKVGQRVIAGQLLGHTDNTGHSTGPHLHFGLCLTDAVGNRLNRGNGTAGWVNPNDRTVANWKIGNPIAPITFQPPPVIPPPPPVEPPPPKLPPIVTPPVDGPPSGLPSSSDPPGPLPSEELVACRAIVQANIAQILMLQMEIKRLTNVPQQVVAQPEPWWMGGLRWLRRVLGS